MLRYDYVDGMLQKRDPYRNDHLAWIRKWSLSPSGTKLLMGGAFADPVDGAAFVFEAHSLEDVESFAKEDPYVVNKLVTHYDIRIYNIVEVDK